jgi:RNA polymerase sigma-70 factor (ECF subfamily)
LLSKCDANRNFFISYFNSMTCKNDRIEKSVRGQFADTTDARTREERAKSHAPAKEEKNNLRPFGVPEHLREVDTNSSFQQHVETDTIARLQRGDLTAFESVYRQFERAAWTLALRLTGRADVAQEVLQDAMLKAFERSRQYRGDAPFAAWLRKLVVNEALMQLRHDRLHVIEMLDDSHGDDAPQPWAFADAATLDRALNRLPDAARAVLWLYHVEGFTHVEIAREFGRSVSFSKSQLARATKRLRELLQPQVEDTPCTIGSTTTA